MKNLENLNKISHWVLEKSKIANMMTYIVMAEGGGVAQWLGRRISDQGVPGSNPSLCTFRCGHEQVTFTLLSTG